MALTLRTDSELEKALDALVKAEGASRQEVIRRAVIDYWHRHELQVVVDESAERNKQKWAEVIERLAST
jgi:predicted transcriptional regulator